MNFFVFDHNGQHADLGGFGFYLESPPVKPTFTSGMIEICFGAEGVVAVKYEPDIVYRIDEPIEGFEDYEWSITVKSNKPTFVSLPRADIADKAARLLWQYMSQAMVEKLSE